MAISLARNSSGVMSSSSSLRSSALRSSRLVTSRLTSCRKGILRRFGQDALERALVADDGLGVLALVGEVVALREQFGTRADGRVRVIAHRRPGKAHEQRQNDEREGREGTHSRNPCQSGPKKSGTRGGSHRGRASALGAGVPDRRFGDGALGTGRVVPCGEGSRNLRSRRAANMRTSFRLRGPPRVWIRGSRSAERKLRITVSGRSSLRIVWIRYAKVLLDLQISRASAKRAGSDL